MTDINLLGQQVQGYTITKKLGAGGYGTVYLGTKEDRSGQYHTAIKHISIPDAAAYDAVMQDYSYDKGATQAHFEKLVAGITSEINTLLNLSKRDNRYIVAYYDHDIQKSLDPLRFDIFMRMEYLTPFNKFVRQKGMTLGEVFKLGIHMCDALALCHGSDIMHRDIKEANIFVSEDSNYKLGDFGVAKTALETTQAGSMKGTASYMAPEIYLREPYDKSVDIYSLGVVLYKLMNNQRLPFMPDAPATYTADDKNNAESKRIRGETPPIPYNAKRRLGEIIIKACSIKTQRYQTAEEFKRDLMEHLDILTGADLNAIVLHPSADSNEPQSPMTEKAFHDISRNSLNSQKQTQDTSMSAADNLTMKNPTQSGTMTMKNPIPTSVPSVQQNPYTDAKKSDASGINKKLIALVSSIAGVLVIGAIIAVLLVVSNNNNDTPAMLNQPPPSEEITPPPSDVATPSPSPSSSPSPTDTQTSDTTPEPQQINFNPIQFFEMSDDLLDYTLIYDGDVFQLPMTLDVFLSYGWETEDDLSGTLVSGQSQFYWFSRGDKRLLINLANLSDEPRQVSRATVFRLKMDKLHSDRDEYIDIELPRGITKGSSNDEVIAAFGEPNDFLEFTMDDGDVIARFSYYNEETDYSAYYRGVEIRTSNGFVGEITVSNVMQLPSDLVSDAVEVSTEITERERNYRTPSELGNNLSSFNVEIDGDLYTLPAPLSAFLNNGWEVPEGATTMLPERTNIGTFELIKGNSRLSHIDLTNFTDRLMYVENCFVISVTSLYDRATITLPGGITVGTPEDTLLGMFGSKLEKKYYSDYESWYYEYLVYDSRSLTTMQRVKIDIDKETLLVSRVEILNRE